MAESYQIIYGKYQRAILSIRELETERDRVEEQEEKLLEEYKQVEKHTKSLCETILKKTREEKEGKPWFQMELLEMVDEAQKGVEEYFTNFRSKIEIVRNGYSERGKQIRQLEQDLEDLKVKHEDEVKKLNDDHETELNTAIEERDAQIKALETSLQTGRLDQDEIDSIKDEAAKKARKKNGNVLSKLGRSVSKSKDSGKEDGGEGKSEEKKDEKDKQVITLGDADFNIILDDKDKNVNNTIADATANMINDGNKSSMINPSSSSSHAHSNADHAHSNADQAIKENIEEKVQEQADINTKEIAKLAKDLTSDQKIAIRVMGEDGWSEWSKISADALENYKENVRTEATLRSHFTQLINKDFVEKTKISTAGTANLGLYRLTDQGKNTFKYLFGKDAVEPEMDGIIRNHTTLEHGYGIVHTAALIKKMPFIQKNNADVVYDTRCKEYTKKLNDNKSYIPDIVITKKGADGQDQTMYIEYETGKCNEKDLFAKCYKIGSFSSKINIIVPDGKTKNLLIERCQKWKQEAHDKNAFPRKTISIRLVSFMELQAAVSGTSGENCNTGIPWTTTITLNSPKSLKKEQRDEAIQEEPQNDDGDETEDLELEEINAGGDTGEH